MRIILDAMGGDKAPEEIVKGAAAHSLTGEADLLLVGDEGAIKDVLSRCRADLSKIEILNAECAVTMEDDPMAPLASKRRSSMSVGLRLLASGGDAFLSAGNTGALFTASSVLVRNVGGVKRAAIATVIPFEKPILILDSGANVNTLPEYFEQWAMLGSIYSREVLGVSEPTVGLLNNGSESHKGDSVRTAAYEALSRCSLINFRGNVESFDLPHAPCDVLLTDGFTGNVTLKLIEGMSVFFFSTMKHLMTETVFTKVFSTPLSGKRREMKRVFDPTEYGGAPILGLAKPVFKAHGSSDAHAIDAAIRQCEIFVNGSVSEKIAEAAKDFIDRTGENRTDD